MTERPREGNRDEQSGAAIYALEDLIDDSDTSTTRPSIDAHEAITEQRHRTTTVSSDPSESVCGVAVAIPAYNEEATIGEIVQCASDHADQVFVVDDGSDDDTADRAAAAGAVVIEHRKNRGYGAALKTGFEMARRYGTRHLAVLDGDGQHDPSDVPRLVAAQENTDAHLVIGSRFVDGITSNIPLYRRIGLKLINGLTNLSMGVVRSSSRVSDTQCGFRVYDQRAIETLARDGNIGDWMDASTDILYHAHHHDYAIEEVSITVEYDVVNANSQDPVPHVVVLVRNILKTIERERPLTALAVPGFGLTFGGLGFGYWAITNYIQSGTFPVGLAFTSAVLILIGIFACFTAIVLHSLSTYFSNNRMQGGVYR